MNGEITGAFTFGVLVGAALTWTLAIAGERVRRIRYDLRTTKKGIKTLRKMLRRNVASLLQAAGVVLVIVAALAWVVTR